MSEKRLYAIIVAGGSGLRMEQSIPKQFIELAGLPILMRTLKAFRLFSESIEIVLVLPKTQIDFWKKLCTQYSFEIPHQIVEGGKTRGESVFNGLKILPDEGLVAIHDGVRPFVSNETIKNSYNTAEKYGTAVAVVDLKDSIREVTPTGSKAVDREMFKIVQTPQTFNLQLIKQAYQQSKSLSYSDDAAVAEAAGHRIELVKGSYENIKITTPEDLIIGQEIIKKL